MGVGTDVNRSVRTARALEERCVFGDAPAFVTLPRVCALPEADASWPVAGFAFLCVPVAVVVCLAWC